MKAAILAVGSELLGTESLDTNSLTLTASLERYGFELGKKSVLGDIERDIAAEVRRLVADFRLVLVTGGLGPTADDVTRPAVAEALGRSVELDAEVLAGIEARFRALGRTMPRVNRRQAEVIEGAELIPNRRGTAPGMRLEVDTSTLFLFPGVPTELAGMIESHLEPWLAGHSGGLRRESAVLKIACRPESEVEEAIAPAYAELGRESITVLARGDGLEVHVVMTATGHEEECRAQLARMSARLRELAGDAVFTDRREEGLEDVVGALLRAAGARLAVAESCTGGLLAERVTRVPGSSDYFLGGAVTYTNELKTALLGVEPELLARRGAVSEEVARAMAEGVRARLGGDYGIGVTGVAGPGGGSAEKPVGTVHIALAGPGEPALEHRRVLLPGDRRRVRWQASQVALELLRRRLLAAARGGSGR